jgi:hypothetical protein
MESANSNADDRSGIFSSVAATTFGSGEVLVTLSDTFQKNWLDQFIGTCYKVTNSSTTPSPTFAADVMSIPFGSSNTAASGTTMVILENPRQALFRHSRSAFNSTSSALPYVPTAMASMFKAGSITFNIVLQFSWL